VDVSEEIMATDKKLYNNTLVSLNMNTL